MAEVNVVDWHITPHRAERWYEAWMPAFERVRAFGALEATMTRSEEDPLHFRQTTVWESREDFERFWSSDEAAKARAAAVNCYDKPLLPTWHVFCATGDPVAARGD